MELENQQNSKILNGIYRGYNEHKTTMIENMIKPPFMAIEYHFVKKGQMEMMINIDQPNQWIFGDTRTVQIERLDGLRTVRASETADV